MTDISYDQQIILDRVNEDNANITFYTSQYDYAGGTGPNVREACARHCAEIGERFGGYAKSQQVRGLVSRGLVEHVGAGWRHITVRACR